MTAKPLRNAAIRNTRIFFARHGFLEVMTPKAVPHPAFEPYIDAAAVKAYHLEENLFLATSPEFALKKQIADELKQNPGAQGIYEIAPVFRDDRPGKNHAIEFTMIEWYARQTTLPATLKLAAELITALAASCANPIPAHPLEILDARELFTAAGKPFDFTREQGVTDLYRSLHGRLPQHLNETDAAIICFNLLFDEFVLPQLRERNHLTAVSHYPFYLGALAYTENGIAERAEIFYRGLEIANGYCEEFRPEKARTLWQGYNEIRRLRGVEPHVVDSDLLKALPSLEGVSGIAVGLERILLAANPGLKLADLR